MTTKRDKITRKIIEQTGIVPEIGMFGLDHLETARIVRRLLKPYGLKLHVKTWREDDQSWVWIQKSDPLTAARDKESASNPNE